MQKWTASHLKILSLTHQNKSIKDIARLAGVSTTYVSSIRQTPLFRDRLEALNNKIVSRLSADATYRAVVDQARQVLNEAAPKAAMKMVELSKTGTKDQKVQFDAAKDILDRAGLKPVEVVEARERVYSPEEISKAQVTLRETETIIMRLERTSSPFVLRDVKAEEQESPNTDEGSANVAPEEELLA